MAGALGVRDPWLGECVDTPSETCRGIEEDGVMREIAVGRGSPSLWWAVSGTTLGEPGLAGPQTIVSSLEFSELRLQDLACFHRFMVETYRHSSPDFCVC